VPGHSPSSPWARHGPVLRAAPLGGGAVRQSFARPRMYGSAAALVGINGHALMPTVSASCYVDYRTSRERVPCYSRR
jgi:hypothetical protein